jgi:hypothetical protein
MDVAPLSLRLLLMFLVLGNGIVLLTQSRPPSNHWTAPIHSTPLRLERPATVVNHRSDPATPIFSLTKSSRPAVNSGNPR